MTTPFLSEPTASNVSPSESPIPATSVSFDPAANRIDLAFLQSRFRQCFFRSTERFLCFLFQLRSKLTFGGREYLAQIPSKQSCIVVANHQSNWDPPLVARALDTPHRISFMAKQELFKGRLGCWVMQHLGAFAVNRARLEKNTLRSAKVVLESQGLWHLGIFPEGSRKEGGDLKQLKAGAAFLAVKNQVPVIPVGVGATHPKESSGVSRQHCHVQVGPLLTPEAGESVDAFSERMLAALMALKAEAKTFLT